MRVLRALVMVATIATVALAAAAAAASAKLTTTSRTSEMTGGHPQGHLNAVNANAVTRARRPTKRPTATRTRSPTRRPTTRLQCRVDDTKKWGYSCGGAIPRGAEEIALAQTHVVAPQGTNWTIQNRFTELHLVGGRDALVMVKFPGITATNAPSVTSARVVLTSATSTTAILLSPPSTLPGTQDDEAPLATDRFWAVIPGRLIKPNTSIRGLGTSATTAAALSTKSYPLNVGADTDVTVFVLPFYLYGANEQNSIPSTSWGITSIPDTDVAEMFTKWPVSNRLKVVNHAIGKVQWPFMVSGPANNKPARVLTDRAQESDGFQTMGCILDVMALISTANGHDNLNVMYWGAALMLRNGEYEDAGGGLGVGSHHATGSPDAGVFFHELGHGFNMGHAEESYLDGYYAYPGGSLEGSAWGFNQLTSEFIPTYLTKSSSEFSECPNEPWRYRDAQKRCIKQDPMQGGGGDQASSDTFTMHGDFNAAVVQAGAEGMIAVDPTSATGFSKWDAAQLKRVPAPRATVDLGLYGLDNNLPYAVNVSVTTVIVSLSKTTPAVNKVFPLLKYRGNLVRTIDPTNASDLASIKPFQENEWTCAASGCDYTLRVTMSDATKRHVLLRGGFRKWYDPAVDDPDANDPLSSSSFLIFSANVDCRGGLSVTQVELLSTPLMGEPDVAFPANPSVVVRASF